MEKKDILAALAALAQETRLDIFRLLVRAGPPGLPAGAIAERLALAAPTLSFHLKELKQAALVAAQREGRSLIYAADFATMNGLIAYLGEACCSDGPVGCGDGICADTASVKTEGG